ncbi:MAG: DUF5685 family protein [Candidatus Borkfalkiaceae bacterium]|nr:DUF5685 family protein [Clostridia bacterium]MDY6222984.1 DUF5685 family protein [Christensenellaceae bacterium]
MFGYVRADTPYLYIKDDNLYKAAYCGVCKAIGEVCGITSRMGLSYDVTFFSVLLHNISGTDLTIENSRCAAHCMGKKRPMAKSDDITRALGAMNTVLAYLKYDDDVKDEKKGRGKRLWFKTGFRRAKKAYPELTETLIRDFAAQRLAEENGGTDSVDRAADATATALADVSDLLLKDKKTDCTRNLFYVLGKWIYLIDALDDYDKDGKSGSYNVFIRAYGAKDGATLLKEYGKEIDYIFNSLFYDIRDNTAGIKFCFNRDLTDNILLRGLPAKTREVKERLSRAGKNCKKACAARGANEGKTNNKDIPSEKEKGARA